MTELLDLYDHRRQPLGRTHPRGCPQPEGSYRTIVHICLFNRSGQMLIQQRRADRGSWPGLWDFTAVGGVRSGETSQQGASRELWEEVGIRHDFSSSPPMLTLCFENHNGKGFDDYYSLRANPDIGSLKLQNSEVQAVRWADLDDIIALQHGCRFVPYHHGLTEFLFYRCLNGSNHVAR